MLSGEHMMTAPVQLIALDDLERLARSCLSMDKDKHCESHIFCRVSSGDLGRFPTAVFDRRLRDKAFEAVHLTLVVLDKIYRQHVGNMSVFLLPESRFQHLHFWRVTTQECKVFLEKITLRDLPGAGYPMVVSHGYIERSLSPCGPAMVQSDSWLVHRYARFVICLAQLCQKRCVPMLLEATGCVPLYRSQIAKSQLSEHDLTAKQRAAIGMTHWGGQCVEKMAHLLGLEEIPDTFNERTLGKVFFSIPAVEPSQRECLRYSLNTEARGANPSFSPYNALGCHQ